MNEFENHMEVRNIVGELIDQIEEIENQNEKIENIDYAIKMLLELKKELL